MSMESINQQMIYDIVNKAQKYEKLLKFAGNEDKLRCSFCGESEEEADTLIAGPGVSICAKCVDLCSDLIEERRQANNR